MPDLSINLWLTISASDGASLSVEMKNCEVRMGFVVDEKRKILQERLATGEGDDVHSGVFDCIKHAKLSKLFEM